VYSSFVGEPIGESPLGEPCVDGLVILKQGVRMRSEFNYWRLVNLCWSVGRTDSFSAGMLRAFPGTCSSQSVILSSVSVYVDIIWLVYVDTNCNICELYLMGTRFKSRP
jgi:hypothetical protein